jgi:CDGSH-type Zn-finger protein
MKAQNMEHKETTFKVHSGGPLEVNGPFRIQGADGKILPREEQIFLCRCGGSANKPYCDGTHKRNGFSG